MPQNRPRIPAEVERQVLIEAGHRCAVCGAELPLERAHIIAWSRSKDHSAANLLCLCANCHGRADTEKWGEETLRQYKQRPWVIRARIEAAAPNVTFSPLHQLPPPPADFTGRAAELAELREAATSGGVTISGVRGMGGIGKTALALALSRELTPLYPDAQIYLDLQGVSANPVSVAQAMAHVIRAFHPDTRLPESEAEIAALYRSALHGQRALLLMDNVAGADQARPLIPPEGCLLLVTSRFFFHLPGFQVKDLDEMPPEDARALLLRIAPRIGEQAERIAAVCAGVPFALRQAAGTLAERPDLSPASYASRLESGKAKLGLIEASLLLSYDLLPDESAGRWRTLSVFTASFDAPAAATVWELEPEPADTALGELVRRSLVDGDDGRYRLHDLARVFADSRCSDEERTGAQRRYAWHYLDVLAQAQTLYLQGGSALLRGLRLFDLEWANIRAGQAWAAGQAAGDQASAELAFWYPHTATDCLDLRLRPAELIGWLETALQAARQLDRRDWEGRTLRGIGIGYAALGETRRAIEFYEQGLAITREIGDRREEANAAGCLGIAYADLGEVRRAIEFQEQCLAIAREIGDRRGEADAMGNLGLAYAALGETRRAIELHEQDLAIAREIGDQRREGKTLCNLGNIYATLGEPRRAIELYEQDLAIAREIGDRRGEAVTTGNLGNAYTIIGETRRAIDLYEQQLAMAREIDNRYEEVRASWNLGEALEKLGELDRAAAMKQVGVDYLREIGHPDAEKRAVEVEALRARMGAKHATPD
jgi:tetratricopeptide (TPR) repeat protein